MARIMAKKGDIEWDVIGKIAIIIIFFLVVLVIVGLLRGKTNSIVETIKEFMRFGR